MEVSSKNGMDNNGHQNFTRLIFHLCDDSGTAAFIRAVAQRKVTASRMGLVWPPSSSVPGTPKTRWRRPVLLGEGIGFTAQVVADGVPANLGWFAISA